MEIGVIAWGNVGNVGSPGLTSYATGLVTKTTVSEWLRRLMFTSERLSNPRAINEKA